MSATSLRVQLWRGTDKAAVRVTAAVNSPVMIPQWTRNWNDGGMVSSVGQRVLRASCRAYLTEHCTVFFKNKGLNTTQVRLLSAQGCSLTRHLVKWYKFAFREWPVGVVCAVLVSGGARRPRSGISLSGLEWGPARIRRKSCPCVKRPARVLGNEGVRNVAKRSGAESAD